MRSVQEMLIELLQFLVEPQALVLTFQLMEVEFKIYYGNQTRIRQSSSCGQSFQLFQSDPAAAYNDPC